MSPPARAGSAGIANALESSRACGFAQLLDEYARGSLRGPFNREARLGCGIRRRGIAALEDSAMVFVGAAYSRELLLFLSVKSSRL